MEDFPAAAKEMIEAVWNTKPSLKFPNKNEEGGKANYAKEICSYYFYFKCNKLDSYYRLRFFISAVTIYSHIFIIILLFASYCHCIYSHCHSYDVYGIFKG